MKAIIVKVIPATNTRPTRLKAHAEGVPPITMSRDAVDDAQDKRKKRVHSALYLARLICKKYNWPTRLASGQLPNGDWVFCFVK